jgi:hypothetical protein
VARIVYISGENEELHLVEIAAQQHMSIIDR